jgi:cobaltochelatase CobS
MATTVDLGTAFGNSALAGKLFPCKHGGESVPTKNDGYIFRADLLRKVLLWMAGVAGKSVYLAGPAGSGKTSLAEQVAARLGWDCITLSCNARTERSDIVGYMGLKDGATAFVDGPLTGAVRNGQMIVFDEGDALPPSITIVLNRVLEGAPLFVPETGETIQPHPDFRIAFTGNTRGRGDESGSFRARQVQDAAILDRFLFVEVDYPTPEDEQAILVKRFGTDLPEEIINLLVRFGNDTRSAHKAGELSAPLSTRGMVRVGEILRSRLFDGKPDPIWESVSFGFADGLGKEECDALQKMLNIIKSAS